MCVVACACNPSSIWEIDARRVLWVWGQPGLHSKVLLQTNESQGSQIFRCCKTRRGNGHFGIRFAFFNQGIQFYVFIKITALSYILSITMTNKTHQWFIRALPQISNFYWQQLMAFYILFSSSKGYLFIWKQTHQLLLVGSLTYRHVLNTFKKLYWLRTFI